MNLYYTIDFEEDFGSPKEERTYYCHKKSKDLIAFLKDHDVQTTLFVTGEIIEKNLSLLEPFLEEPNFFDIQLHSYNHDNVFDSDSLKLNNLKKGMEVFEKFFGSVPRLYRAPFGIISQKEIEFLNHAGVNFGSNFFPSYFPFRFNHLHLPKTAFRIQNTTFTEIPFSVSSKFRIPLSLSYIQLLGWHSYKYLFGLNPTVNINFNSHLHDIFPKEAYRLKKMSFSSKLAYFRSSRNNYAFKVFEKIIQFYIENRFKFIFLKEFTISLEKAELPILSFDEIFKNTK